VADDHEAMREGVQKLIERQPGWEVCATAVTGREAVEKAEQLRPDVVVLDWSMPELDGLNAARAIRTRVSETEVLIFTAYENDDLIQDAFASGAKGFVFKFEAASQLLEAIKSLSEHRPFFTPAVSNVLFGKSLHRLRAQPKRSRDPARGRLTARERELVRLVAEGKSNTEVAKTLGVSIRTTEKCRAAVMGKLDLESVAELTRYAVRNRIIEA
jgi:DNA-binding NarL/FixJ family response regulator